MPVHPLDCDEKITFNMCQSLSKTHSNCLYNKLKHIYLYLSVNYSKNSNLHRF